MPAREGWLVALAVACIAGCRPETVTGARDQLGRGGEREVSLSLPVTVDSALVVDFLVEDSDTVINGIVAVKLGAQTLQVPVVDSFVVPVRFDTSSIDFGDFQDAVQQSTLNQARAVVTLTNPTVQPVVITGFQWGVVELNPDGSVPLDGSGTPAYETDSAGAPVVIAVSDPARADVTVGANATHSVEVEAGPLADALAHMVLDGRDAAVVLTGSGTGGVGFTILTGVYDVAVLFDLTLPSAGVVITTNDTQSGADFEQDNIDQIVERLALASFSANATNGTPFAAEIDIAFIAGDVGDADVFQLPGAVTLSLIELAGGTADASGVVAAPTADTVVVALTGAQARPMLGAEFTSTSRIRLIPTAATRRAVVRPSDVIVLDARASLTLRAGRDQ